MRHLCWLLAAAAAGCTTFHSVPSADPQYQSARSCADPVIRSHNLANAAIFAGSIGDADTVKKALADLAAEDRHDEVAEAAAFELSNAGKLWAAVEVARLIKNPNRRRAAVEKVGGP